MKDENRVLNALPATNETASPMRKKKSRTNHGQRGGKRDSSERLCPQPDEYLNLDPRLPELLFNSLASVQVAIMSASKDVPYNTLRQALALDPQEKTKLTSAAQVVAAKHAAFFAQHKDALEFVIGLMAFHAAQMDHLFSLLDQRSDSTAPAEPVPRGQYVCSAREVMGMKLMVLAPLGSFVLVLLIQHLRRK